MIIGGGPAGITAGIYAARKKLHTLLITKDFIGQAGVTGIIENWPGEGSITGPELMKKFENHLRSHDIEIKEGEEVQSVRREGDALIVKKGDEEVRSKAVLGATGRRMRELGIPGEREFTGKGVVYCTTCDAPFFKDKKVVVAGGGNSGFEAAIELTDHADEVHVLEVASEFGADEFLKEQAKEKGVQMFTQMRVEEVRGEKFVNEIIYRDLEKDKGESMNVDGLFVQIGSDAISEPFKGVAEVNEGGDIKVDPRSCATGTKGMFAAGDVTDVRDKQIVVSAGEGAKAALSVYEYLKG